MKNGWTGGQYSLYRAVFGVYLLVHFVAVIPREIPRSASPLLRLFPNILAVADVALPLIAIAAIASVLFAIGLFDRIAAVVMGYALACFLGRIPMIGWLLLAHVLLPPAPFGSWKARGRVDPRGNWSMPPTIVAAAWIVLSLGYTYIGYTKLPAAWGALALLYAPLALFRRVRPWLWLATLLMIFGLIVFADLSLGMVIVHFFIFDPAWVPRRAPATTDRVLYDGSCGLCHRSVRFLIAEDVAGTSFVYAPQEGGGATVIVETADGKTLTKSAAVIHLAHRLGGLWRVLAIAFSLIPRPLRDRGYDFVARIRYRIFGRTKDACPLMPPDLRSRFTV